MQLQPSNLSAFRIASYCYSSTTSSTPPVPHLLLQFICRWHIFLSSPDVMASFPHVVESSSPRPPLQQQLNTIIQSLQGLTARHDQIQWHLQASKNQLSTTTKCLDILINMVCKRESSQSNNVPTTIIENPIVETSTTYPHDEVVGTQVLDFSFYFS